MKPFSRRTFLRHAPVAAAMTAIPLPAAATPTTAQERYDFHLAEFRKAAEELDPEIGYWHQSGKPGDESPCILVLNAFRRTGRYEGDGSYEAGKDNWNGSKTIYKVRLLDASIDGERLFDVTCPGSRMQLIESRLNTFIGRRIGPIEI